jgi:hypothetical protein
MLHAAPMARSDSVIRLLQLSLPAAARDCKINLEPFAGRGHAEASLGLATAESQSERTRYDDAPTSRRACVATSESASTGAGERSYAASWYLLGSPGCVRSES